MRILENLKITGLIGRAPWREAVAYRDIWPHEYVLSRQDGQHELVELVEALTENMQQLGSHVTLLGA